MKTTPYYGFAYPESGDHTRTWEYWQSQVEAIEAKLKGGYRIPTGDLNLGDPTISANRSLNIERLDVADAIMVQIFPTTGGVLHIRLLKNLVEVNKLILQPTGAVQVLSGGITRPIPYAIAAGQSNVPVNNSTGGQVTITLPAGRFTSPPLVHGTSEEATYHMGVWPVSGTTSFTALVQQINAGVATLSVGTHWLATQMLPTAGPGLRDATPGRLNTRPTVMFIATCHTVDCDNADVPIEIEIPYEEGQPPPTDPYVACGVCGEPIADVVPG